MDKVLIARHLAEAENHVRTATMHVQHQRQLIDELARDGHNTLKARSLLEQFEETLSLHASNRARIARELREAEAAEQPRQPYLSAL